MIKIVCLGMPYFMVTIVSFSMYRMSHGQNPQLQKKCMKLIRVQSMYTMTPMYHDRHMKKFKRVMRYIKLISMHRRLFWMHLDVHEVV
jgi:hypothetical protein